MNTDEIMALANDLSVESLRLGSYERRDIYLNNSVSSWETTHIRDKREAARQRLRTAIEALVADAERYRWLRESDSDDARVFTYRQQAEDWFAYATPEDIDAAIDAARGRA